MNQPPRTPPRFVPTLTEVVQSSPPAVTPGPDLMAQIEEQIIHRVMQRVDLSLERRLREAVATLVLEQTRSLGPLLREEIESVVRQSVSEAVSEELAHRSQRP